MRTRSPLSGRNVETHAGNSKGVYDLAKQAKIPVVLGKMTPKGIKKKFGGQQRGYSKKSLPAG